MTRFWNFFHQGMLKVKHRGRRGRDHMVVGFTCAFSAYHHSGTKLLNANPIHGKMYSIQHYVIKYVYSEL